MKGAWDGFQGHHHLALFRLVAKLFHVGATYELWLTGVGT
jgi:hypothetical protein